MNTATTVRAVPVGEYVRLKDSPTAPVYVRGAYDAATKKFSLSKADDINAEVFRKAEVIVYVGFTY